MKVSQRISELQTQTVGFTLGWLQFTKAHNSVKTVDAVTVHNLYTLGCIFVLSFKKISQRIWKLLSRCNLHTEIYKAALFCKRRKWNYGTCYPYIAYPKAGATKMSPIPFCRTCLSKAR